MRPGIPLLTIALTAVAACAEPAVAPTADHPRHLAPAASATTDRSDGVLIITDLVFLDCVGEDVAFDAAVPFRSHTTVTPGGRTVYLEPFVPHSGAGAATGQSTGRVWNLTRVVSPLVAQWGGTAGLVHFTAVQRWERDGGPTMLLHSLLHLSQNASGTVTVEKFVLDRCQLL